MVRIYKNIPIPGSEEIHRKTKYPWMKMKVGDSILIPKGIKYPAALASDASRKYRPRKFIARQVHEGRKVRWRIWRIEDEYAVLTPKKASEVG